MQFSAFSPVIIIITNILFKLRLNQVSNKPVPMVTYYKISEKLLIVGTNKYINIFKITYFIILFQKFTFVF